MPVAACSPETRKSPPPPSPRGSFRFKSFPPPTDHAAELICFLGEERVFFVVERVQLPCDAYKEFQKISFPHSNDNRRQFLRPALIACDEQAFEDVYECCIYLVTEGVSRRFRKIIPIPMPSLVYCYRMLDDRQNALGGGLL